VGNPTKSLRGALRRGNLIEIPRRLLRRYAPRNDHYIEIAALPTIARNDSVIIINAFVLISGCWQLFSFFCQIIKTRQGLRRQERRQA
jgi:hypothetical protein